MSPQSGTPTSDPQEPVTDRETDAALSKAIAFLENGGHLPGVMALSAALATLRSLRAALAAASPDSAPAGRPYTRDKDAKYSEHVQALATEADGDLHEFGCATANENDPDACNCVLRWWLERASPDSAPAGLDVERLKAVGFEPDFNVCAHCHHHGGRHDLGNWCLDCPRPDDWDRASKSPTGAKVDAGWCYFSSMSKAEQWAWGAAEYDRLRATPASTTGPGAEG